MIFWSVGVTGYMTRRKRFGRLEFRQSGCLSLSRTVAFGSWLRSSAVWSRAQSSAFAWEGVCPRDAMLL